MNSSKKLAKIINQRKSSRVFLNKTVSKSVLVNCLEAARWAPSSSNNQPWRFIVVDKRAEQRPALERTLEPGNAWAKAAPVLVVVCANRNDDPDYAGGEYYAYDTGMAMMSFVLQAQYEGVRCHQMAGFDHPAAKRALSIPRSAMVFAIMAVGYEGKLSQANEQLRKKEQRPRTRKALQDIAFYGMYGKA